MCPKTCIIVLWVVERYVIYSLVQSAQYTIVILSLSYLNFLHVLCVCKRTSRQNEQGMTLKEAVNLLGEDNVEAQITAANFIQSQCFTRPDAKEKVNHYDPPLMRLTRMMHLAHFSNSSLNGCVDNKSFRQNETMSHNAARWGGTWFSLWETGYGLML